MRAVYFGWYIVATAFIALAMLIGIIVSSFGVFVVPVSRDLELSRASMNTCLILINVGGALASPWIGQLLDRLPMRRILIGSVLVLGSSLIGLGLSRSIWLSATLLALPIALAMQGAGLSSMSVLIARWFTVQRGRALVLGMLGTSFGAIVMPPVLGALVEYAGWRQTLVYCGIAFIVVLVPLFSFVRDRPGQEEMEISGGVPTPQTSQPSSIGRPVAVSDILKDPSFWAIAITAALALGVVQACQASLAPIAVGKGKASVEAATLISIAGGGAVASKLVFVAFADRIDRVTLLAGLYAVLGLACGILLMTTSMIGLALAAIGIGIGNAIAPFLYALLADRFGPASYGTVQGLTIPIICFVSAIALRFAGEVYDRTGEYDYMFYVFIAVQLGATAFLYLTLRTRAATVHTKANTVP